MLEHFRIELLNRFDRVVPFEPLDREDVRAIARRELDSLRSRVGLAGRSLRLEVDEDALDWIVGEGHDPDFGARLLRRTLERHLTSAVAELLVHCDAPAGACVRVQRMVQGVSADWSFIN